MALLQVVAGDADVLNKRRWEFFPNGGRNRGVVLVEQGYKVVGGQSTYSDQRVLGNETRQYRTVELNDKAHAAVAGVPGIAYGESHAKRPFLIQPALKMLRLQQPGTVGIRMKPNNRDPMNPFDMIAEHLYQCLATPFNSSKISQSFKRYLARPHLAINQRLERQSVAGRWDWRAFWKCDVHRFYPRNKEAILP